MAATVIGASLLKTASTSLVDSTPVTRRRQTPHIDTTSTRKRSVTMVANTTTSSTSTKYGSTSSQVML